jgi:hypothetical protein
MDQSTSGERGPTFSPLDFMPNVGRRSLPTLLSIHRSARSRGAEPDGARRGALELCEHLIKVELLELDVRGAVGGGGGVEKDELGAVRVAPKRRGE